MHWTIFKLKEVWFDIIVLSNLLILPKKVMVYKSAKEESSDVKLIIKVSPSSWVKKDCNYDVKSIENFISLVVQRLSASVVNLLS